MTRDERAELRAAMNEASLLGPESSLRQQVESDVHRAGTWAEEEWMQLLQDDERLRIELRRVDVPDEVKARLKRIPRDLPRRPILSLLRPLLAAAAVLLLVGLPLYWTSRAGAEVDELSLQNIVVMASDDHLNDRHLVVRTEVPDEFVRALQTEVDFEVGMPSTRPEGIFLGGRRCRWAGCSVIYSLWKVHGELQSLIQFCPKQFRLPESMTERVVEFSQPGHPELATSVLIWTENGKGFAQVRSTPGRS